jgi:hypothetical protein
MSKLLKRALKYAVVPAVLMITGKILGIFLVSIKYGYPVEIGNDINGFFSTQIYFNDAQITYFVNSISDLVMLLVISVPLIYQIVKTALFQSTMNNPKTIVKAAKFNILSWITNDDTTFLQTFIWCAFLWLTTGLIIKNSIEGDTYSWIAYVAGVLSLFSGLSTLKMFEIEIDKVYPDSKRYY